MKREDCEGVGIHSGPSSEERSMVYDTFVSNSLRSFADVMLVDGARVKSLLLVALAAARSLQRSSWLFISRLNRRRIVLEYAYLRTLICFTGCQEPVVDIQAVCECLGMW